MQPQISRCYFDKLQAALENFGIYPADCYNMDMTGYQIGIGAELKVITRNARCRAFGPSYTNCGYVTVVECVNAYRKALLSFVIMPGKNVAEA